uniref:Uncharacterized protein n=1 Tax=Siphoviridae sp. ctvNP11 TaxID=2825721 RepID=A0A8S5PF90_9CAUD|nr:MAG TPA: hypothetical protein [Siphoviridae sp. ctvNP11]DAS45046.1 MAG TPA: hypothetical protein [Caudoviricetes sp.]
MGPNYTENQRKSGYIYKVRHAFCVNQLTSIPDGVEPVPRKAGADIHTFYPSF